MRVIDTADIIIIGLILFGALQGYRKGLISGFLGLAGNILGLIVAGKQYLTAYAWLDQHTPLRNWLEPYIFKMLLPSVQSQTQLTQQQTVDRILALIPGELRSMAGKGILPDMKAYTENAVQSLVKALSVMISENLMKLIAFALLYFLIVLLAQVIAMVLLGILGPLAGSVNRGGGLILGTISVVVGLAVFVGLLTPLITLAGKDTFLDQLQKAQMYPYLLQVYVSLSDLLHLNLDFGLKAPLEGSTKTLPVLKLY